MRETMKSKNKRAGIISMVIVFFALSIEAFNEFSITENTNPFINWKVI
jgi:hypothetical protein